MTTGSDGAFFSLCNVKVGVARAGLAGRSLANHNAGNSCEPQHLSWTPKMRGISAVISWHIWC